MRVEPAWAASSIRELKVGVAVTPTFKEQKNWQVKFTERLAYASKIFETEFGIKFRITQVWGWNVTQEKQDSDFLLADLMSRFPLYQVDCVIGLSRLTHTPTVENVRDLDTLGRTQPFSGYLVVRYPANTLFRIQEETVLVHELGHLFGAVHTKQISTIMSPIVEKQIPSVFDSENRQIIRLTRDMDFKKGIQVLDQQTTEQLLASYLVLMKYDQPFGFYYALGKFYLKLGQDKEALKALVSARKLKHDVPILHYDLGVLYWKLGKDEEARISLTKAIGGFSGAHEKVYKAQAMKLLGGVFFRKGNLDAAYQNWVAALVLDPQDLDLKVNLAVLQLEQGKFDEAIRNFLSVLEHDPDNVKILSNLGSAYFRKGKFAEAAAYLQKTLDLYESKRPAVSLSLGNIQPGALYERLAVSQLEMGKVEPAFQSMRKACDLDSSSECRMRLGKLYFDRSRWAEATVELEEAVKRGAKSLDLYGMLGVALAQRGDLQAAVRVFRQALVSAKDGRTASVFHKNIANLYMQDQRLTEARQEFEFAIAKDPSNAEAYFGLALTQLANAETEHARTSLKNVIRLVPGHPKAKEILSNIEAQQKR